MPRLIRPGPGARAGRRTPRSDVGRGGRGEAERKTGMRVRPDGPRTARNDGQPACVSGSDGSEARNGLLW
jgi:hypothetical protein